MQHKELTEQVIGCAFSVWNRMGFGFLEAVYEKCLLIELRDAGLRAAAQHSIAVTYKGEPVGQFVADLLVNGELIVELKSVRQLTQSHEVQLVNYLVATGTDVGLLLNFGPDGVQVKRKVRTLA